MRSRRSRVKVVIDFDDGSDLGRDQRWLLEELARRFEGQQIVLSTSGKVGDREVPVINFLVTLKRGRVKQPQPVAV